MFVQALLIRLRKCEGARENIAEVKKILMESQVAEDIILDVLGTK